MIDRDGEPSVQDALEAFPEERLSEQPDYAVNRAMPSRDRSSKSLFEFVPAGPPVDLAVTSLLGSTSPRRLQWSGLRRLLFAGLRGTQTLTGTIVVGASRELAHARRRVKKRVVPLMSAATVLVPHRPPLSSSIVAGFTMVIVVLVASLTIPRPTRASLPARGVASWVPFALPAGVSFERPLFGAVQGQQPSPSAGPRSAPARQDTMAIQRSLNRYRDGFSVLDAAAVKAVWPSADEDALRKRFAGLYDQNLEFTSCRISVTAATANALCMGNVSYVRSQNTKQRRDERRQWQFTLVNDGTRWIIRTVDDGSDLASKAEVRDTVATKENDGT